MPGKILKFLATTAVFTLIVFGCGPVTAQIGELCLTTGMSVTAAAFAMSVIAAPLVEEGAKRAGIETGRPWLFVAVFVAVEFSVYVLMGAFAVLRIPAAVMHWGTMHVQVRTTEMAKRTKGKKATALLWGGWFLAVAVHALFNWAALNASQ